jgi:molybdopterin synthase sulfur carrier subunit
MSKVTLTAHLIHQAGLQNLSQPLSIPGTTVRQVVDALCEQYPRLRGYLLEDQGALRHHVAAFVNGQVVRDKATLAQPLRDDDELSLLQALSGG